jgi:hypothetical protein
MGESNAPSLSKVLGGDTSIDPIVTTIPAELNTFYRKIGQRNPTNRALLSERYLFPRKGGLYHSFGPDYVRSNAPTRDALLDFDLPSGRCTRRVRLALKLGKNRRARRFALDSA